MEPRSNFQDTAEDAERRRGELMRRIAASGGACPFSDTFSGAKVEEEEGKCPRHAMPEADKAKCPKVDLLLSQDGCPVYTYILELVLHLLLS